MTRTHRLAMPLSAALLFSVLIGLPGAALAHEEDGAISDDIDQEMAEVIALAEAKIASLPDGMMKAKAVALVVWIRSRFEAVQEEDRFGRQEQQAYLPEAERKFQEILEIIKKAGTSGAAVNKPRPKPRRALAQRLCETYQHLWSRDKLNLMLTRLTETAIQAGAAAPQKSGLPARVRGPHQGNPGSSLSRSPRRWTTPSFPAGWRRSGSGSRITRSCGKSNCGGRARRSSTRNISSGRRQAGVPGAGAALRRPGGALCRAKPGEDQARGVPPEPGRARRPGGAWEGHRAGGPLPATLGFIGESGLVKAIKIEAAGLAAGSPAEHVFQETAAMIMESLVDFYFHMANWAEPYGSYLTMVERLLDTTEMLPGSVEAYDQAAYYLWSSYRDGGAEEGLRAADIYARGLAENPKSVFLWASYGNFLYYQLAQGGRFQPLIAPPWARGRPSRPSAGRPPSGGSS